MGFCSGFAFAGYRDSLPAWTCLDLTTGFLIFGAILNLFMTRALESVPLFLHHFGTMVSSLRNAFGVWSWLIFASGFYILFEFITVCTLKLMVYGFDVTNILLFFCCLFCLFVYYKISSQVEVSKLNTYWLPLIQKPYMPYNNILEVIDPLNTNIM